MHIAKDLGIPYSTVQWHLQKTRSGQQIHQVQKGRPRKTTPRTDKTIVLTAKKNRFVSSSNLAAQFFVSRRTIRRRCAQFGLKKHRALEDELQKRHKMTRVQWCREHLKTNFRNWLFSDESSFELAALSIPRRQMVYRTIKEKYSKCCIVTGGLLNRRSVIFWGTISTLGPACFALLDANVNAHSFIFTLATHLLP